MFETSFEFCFYLDSPRLFYEQSATPNATRQQINDSQGWSIQTEFFPSSDSFDDAPPTEIWAMRCRMIYRMTRQNIYVMNQMGINLIEFIDKK